MVTAISGFPRVDLFPLLGLLAETSALRDDLEGKRHFLLSRLGGILGAETVAWKPAGRPWRIVLKEDERIGDAAGFSPVMPDGDFEDGIRIFEAGNQSCVFCRREVSSGVPACIVFHRRADVSAFGAGDVGVLGLLLEEIPWLYDDGLRDFPMERGIYELSPRELTVLELLCKGHSRNEIAELLGLSEHTVSDYAKSVFKKVGVNSQTQLIGHALRERPFPNTQPTE